MQRQQWRILQDQPSEASWNMAMDEALLESVLQGRSPQPILRLYTWVRPAVTIGRFQNVQETIDLRLCEELSIPIVRRMTGGRGILHGEDLTISVIARTDSLLPGATDRVPVVDLYRQIARLYIPAFERVGIEAAFGQCALPVGRHSRANCFASISQADVIEVSTGRKLLGAALYKKENFVIQQASLPLHSEGKFETNGRIEDVFLNRGSTEMTKHQPVDAQVFIEALIQQIPLCCEDKYSDWEKERALALCDQKYRQGRWNLQGRNLESEVSHPAETTN